MKVVTNNGLVKGGLDMDLHVNSMKVNPINDRLTPVTTLIPVLHTHQQLGTTQLTKYLYDLILEKKRATRENRKLSKG